MTTTPNFLIVDDSITTRSVIKRIIQIGGLPLGQLFEAGNGKEALAVMQSHPVHLVLADINMPVMDGVEMVIQMRQQESLRQIPVIVISAQPDEAIIEQLKQLGISRYLAKPFTPERVRDMIEGELLGTKAGDVQTLSRRHESIDRMLARALGEALEIMAFMGTSLPQEMELDASEDLHRACVSFSGTRHKGTFTLTASKHFGAAVAENCALADAFANADDALKELTNVACGVFLRSHAGGANGFKLDPPVIETGGSVVPRRDHPNQVTVLADGFMVAAELKTDCVASELWN